MTASPLSTRLDRDRLLHMHRDRAIDQAFKLLDPMATMKPHEALVASAIVFAAFAARFEQDPSELHAIGMKILREEDPLNKTGNAARDALQDFARLKLRYDKPFI